MSEHVTDKNTDKNWDEEVDLLVLGTHGRRGIARWLLGSVAARTARLVDTPVLLARSGEATAD